MKRRFRKTFVTRSPLLVLIAEPPTQPPAGMHIDRAVGFADCTQTEVVGPADQHAIELLYECLRSCSHHITACATCRVAFKRPSAPEAPAASLPPLPLRLLPGEANQFPGGSCTR